MSRGGGAWGVRSFVGNCWHRSARGRLRRTGARKSGSRLWPKMLAEVFASLAANTSRKDFACLWLYVDEDDTVTRDAIAVYRTRTR